LTTKHKRRTLMVERKPTKNGIRPNQFLSCKKKSKNTGVINRYFAILGPFLKVFTFACASVKLAGLWQKKAKSVN
jgi:hypothetical protein